MEWQPIETAPKDGTVIDLYVPQADPQRVADAYWKKLADIDKWLLNGMFPAGDGCSGWWAPNNWYDGADGPVIDLEPTHWMPLPAPPS